MRRPITSYTSKRFCVERGIALPRAAAYRANVRIRDENFGATHDYTDRTDVALAKILLPVKIAGVVDMDWALKYPRHHTVLTVGPEVAKYERGS
jgi:hypothetical protein